MSGKAGDGDEIRALERRIRGLTLATSLGFLLQFALLGAALTTGTPTTWVVWVAALVGATAVAAIALPRARRLSRRYRELKWGERP